MRRKDSPTLKAWRESTRPSIEASAAYWTGRTEEAETAGDDGVALSTRGDDTLDKLNKAIEALRYPESRSLDSTPPAGWPAPLGEDAYHGLAGDVIRSVAPYTEASPEALLTDLLASFGVMVGRGPYYRLGGDVQQPRLNVAVVGDTARGRKGAARGVIARVTENADLVALVGDIGLMPWTHRHYLKGLTSGEGLVSAVEKTGADGRVLIIEEEFGRLITAAAREGSTLSPLIREAYDRNRLQVANKNTPLEVSNAYIGIVANITQAELMSAFGATKSTETRNGFANRFLYIASRRPHKIARTHIPDGVIERATSDLRDAVKRARRVKEVTFSKPAEAVWDDWYYAQPDAEGLYGAVTSRLDVHAVRVAMVYALLDGSRSINARHVKAALEVIRYADDSARHILGDSTGNPLADRILRALRKMDLTQGAERDTTPMTRTQILRLCSNHATKEEVDNALEALRGAQLIRETTEATGGRPRTLIEAV